MWPSHTGDYPALRGDPDPCSSVDEPGGHNAERNKPITKEQALRDSAQRRTHRSELPRDGSGCRQAGEGRRGVFRGDRASVWGDGAFWRWMWDVPRGHGPPDPPGLEASRMARAACADARRPPARASRVCSPSPEAERGRARDAQRWTERGPGSRPLVGIFRRTSGSLRP